jgi:hypothetical protein
VWARPADHTRPPGQPGYGPPPRGPTPKGSNPSRISLRGPLSIVLIAVIVVSLVAGGLLAAELYTRHTVNSRVAASAECVVGDKVTVSFGLKPLLLQHMTSDYGPISIITAGNQIRGAKRMKAEVEIDNVHLDGNDQSKGTIGVLDAAVTWPSSGITRSVQDAIPLLSSFVSGARTHPLDGTIELRGALGISIIVKPKVVNNAISLQVVSLTALGLTLPRAGVQSELKMRTSAWMSRPITTSSPATNVCAEPSYRTVSSGAGSWAIGVRAGICTSYKADRTPHDAVSVIGCNTATRPPRRVMMWANTASTAEPPSRAWPSRDRAPLSGCRRGGRYSTGYDIQRVDRGARRAHGCLCRRTSSGWKV